MAIQRALLLIADIGGYTKFMKVHRINLAHAQVVVGRLLEAVIDAGRGRLKLNKLEGDAALFWAPVKAGGSLDVVDLAAHIHTAFCTRRSELNIDRLCSCDGCVQVADLKLKFVAHVGEVAQQKVKRWTELAGVDVIVVHRLLKNGVPLAEYVLATESALDGARPEVRALAVRLEERFEGLEDGDTFYLDLHALEPPPALARGSTWWRRLWSWVRLTWRALPYMLGLRTPCDGFRNMDTARAEVEGARHD
jgi:hypothetical protein